MLTGPRIAAIILPALLALAVAPVALAQDDGEAVDERVAAIEALARDAAESPDDVGLLIDLGNLYYEAGMETDALATYLAVVELDSTHVGALTNLGSLYTDMGEFGAAEERLRRALALDSANAMVYTNLGTNYYAGRKYYEAIEMYRQALVVDPDSVEAHFNLAVAFADAQIFEEAVREWQKVIELDPKGAIAQICRDNIDMINDFRGGK